MFTFLRYLSGSLILLVSPLAAQDAGNGAKPEKLFESVETMELSLTAPWHEL